MPEARVIQRFINELRRRKVIRVAIFYGVVAWLLIYALEGEHDRAMGLLEKAVLPGMANRVWLEHDSDLDALRTLPRFKAFMATLQ